METRKLSMFDRVDKATTKIINAGVNAVDKTFTAIGNAGLAEWSNVLQGAALISTGTNMIIGGNPTEIAIGGAATVIASVLSHISEEMGL